MSTKICQLAEMRSRLDAVEVILIHDYMVYTGDFLAIPCDCLLEADFCCAGASSFAAVCLAPVSETKLVTPYTDDPRVLPAG